MSYCKNDQVFPGITAANIEHKITHAVAHALRQDYQELNSAVKWIGRKTGIHPRAIRNWYEGKNAPNSLHLLILAHHHPRILQVILELAGQPHLWDNGMIIIPLHYMNGLVNGMRSGHKIISDKLVTINVTLPSKVASALNQRQLWFIGKLQKEEKARAADIASTWRVTLRTAKRDIAMLVKMKVIDFVGDNRTGYYQLLK